MKILKSNFGIGYTILIYMSYYIKSQQTTTYLYLFSYSNVTLTAINLAILLLKITTNRVFWLITQLKPIFFHNNIPLNKLDPDL